MTQTIHLHAPEAGSGDPRKLNLFPGRALSEREFELLQDYVDDRIGPLAGLLPSGVVSGLEVRVAGGGGDTRLRFLPGKGVGAGGQLVRLFYPIEIAWTALAEQAERDLDGALRNGFYFLTLRSVVEDIDPPDDRAPCTRSEVDPTRDRRHEVVAVPSLQWISGNVRWLGMARSRAANRICVHFLERSPFEAATGALPLGLVKVMEGIPEWIDTVAGRYLAEPDNAYRTFLAHTVTAWQDWAKRQTETAVSDRARPKLSEEIGLDYLPAAGPFAQALLLDPAGAPPWLGFAPGDLQIELAPVPASTVQDVIEAELPRGTISLVHGRGDRLRLLLAIPDPDYSRNLLDLPLRDLALEAELFQRYNAATGIWSSWRSQWQGLFGGLDAAALKLAQAPSLPPAPVSPDSYRSYLVSTRRASLDPALALPEPYASHIAAPYTGLIETRQTDTTSSGLHAEKARLEALIRDIETDLDESYALINDVTDYLGLQRQHLDNLTVSFGALAGGVAGDGSGLNLMRWTKSAALTPSVTGKEGSS